MTNGYSKHRPPAGRTTVRANTPLTDPRFVVPPMAGVPPELARWLEEVLAVNVETAKAETRADLLSAGILKVSSKSWSVVKIFLGVAASTIVAIFMAGIAYQEFMSGRATKADITKHDQERVMPLETRVEAVETDVGEVKRGVTTLVETDKRETRVRSIERRLAIHRSEHQDAMNEYTAAKAAGQRPARPRKTAEHVELEATLEELVDP